MLRKKYLSILIALSMALGLMPAYAIPVPADTAVTHTEAAEAVPEEAGDTEEAQAPVPQEHADEPAMGFIREADNIESPGQLFFTDSTDYKIVGNTDEAYTFIERSWNAETSEVVSTEKNVPGCTRMSDVPDNAFESAIGNGQWYLVDQDCTFSERLFINGTANIVLIDGTTLTCEKGINVDEGHTLNIYGQTEDSGKLVAKGDTDNAGIGSYGSTSGTINIYGGTIEANGGKYAAGIGGGDNAANGEITVYGGSVTTEGGEFGAGIGSGDEAASTGPITIYGGEIYAQAGDEAAGIGGGNEVDGGLVTILGGDVTAKGTEMNGPTFLLATWGLGAGIGGGDEGDGGTVHIYGGKVNVVGGYKGAGIGSGSQAKGGTVEIKNAEVTALAGYNAAAIGGGYNSPMGTVIIENSTVKAISGSGYYGIGCGLTTSNPEVDDPDSFLRISGGDVTAQGYPHGICCNTLEISNDSKVLIQSTIKNYISGEYLTSPALSVNEIPVLYDRARVRLGTVNEGSGEVARYYLSAEQRIPILKDTDVMEIYIAPCTDHSGIYEMTSETHRKVCYWCSEEIEPEAPHTFADGKCTVCEYAGETGPAFMRNSLALGGSIGVNFFMYLPSLERFDYSGSYMEFTISGKNGKTTTAPYDPNFMNADKTLYGFSCCANTIQMADTITAVFHFKDSGTEKTIEKTCTVEDMIKEYVRRADEDPDTYGTYLPLVKALADYGHYAQPYLAEQRSWTIGTDHAEMQTYYKQGGFSVEEAAEALVSLENKTAVVRKNSDIEKITASLQLDSDTAIFLNVKRADSYTGGITARVAGVPASVKKQKDGRYKITIPNIGADKLGNMYEVEIITESDPEPASVKVSAMSYVAASLGKQVLPEKERNAMMALYEYYKAALKFVD